MKTIFGLTLMMLLVACQPNDLKTIYESKQKEIGNEGVLAIHVDERETFAVVIGARDGKTFPGATHFEKSGGDWEMQMGTSCDGISASLGIAGDLAIYCGSFNAERPYTKATVGTDIAKVIDLGGGSKVWYVVSQRGQKAQFSN
jgi:hypothetical protein